MVQNPKTQQPWVQNHLCHSPAGGFPHALKPPGTSASSTGKMQVTPPTPGAGGWPSEHPLVMSPFLLFNIHHTLILCLALHQALRGQSYTWQPGHHSVLFYFFHSFFKTCFWWSFPCKTWARGQAHKLLFHHCSGGRNECDIGCAFPWVSSQDSTWDHVYFSEMKPECDGMGVRFFELLG